MDEIWKPIPDYPNYEASNRGRVRSLPRVDRAGRKRKGKMLKPFGECNVTPFGGLVQYVSVGHLVLRAFKGRPKPGQIARHLDGNAWHNDLSNLAWRTKHTLETRAKMSASQKGKKLSLSTRQRMSEAQKRHYASQRDQRVLRP